MYCKFCGSKIENGDVCNVCGAKIDPNDGGQTFFDDDELNEWKTENLMSRINTTVPSTQIINQESDKTDKKVTPLAHSMPVTRRSTDAGLKMGNSDTKEVRQAGNKTDNKLEKKLSGFKLSKSNKIIAACILYTLILVLATVGVIAVFSGKGNNDKTKSTQTESTQSKNAESQKKSADKADSADSSDGNADSEKSKGTIYLEDMVEIRGKTPDDKKVAVYRDGERQTFYDGDVTNAKAFDECHEVYLCIDKIQKLTDYKYSSEDSKKEGSNCAVYVKYDTGEKVKIDKSYGIIYLIDKTGDKQNTQSTSENCAFNDGEDTYVNAEKFFTLLGNKVKISESEEDGIDIRIDLN